MVVDLRTGVADLHTGEIGRGAFGDVLGYHWASPVPQRCSGQVVGECESAGQLHQTRLGILLAVDCYNSDPG